MTVTSDFRLQLRRMNHEIEALYRDGRDLDAHNLETRADALARRYFRAVAAQKLTSQPRDVAASTPEEDQNG